MRKSLQVLYNNASDDWENLLIQIRNKNFIYESTYHLKSDQIWSQLDLAFLSTWVWISDSQPKKNKLKYFLSFVLPVQSMPWEIFKVCSFQNFEWRVYILAGFQESHTEHSNAQFVLQIKKKNY